MSTADIQHVVCDFSDLANIFLETYATFSEAQQIADVLKAKGSTSEHVQVIRRPCPCPHCRKGSGTQTTASSTSQPKKAKKSAKKVAEKDETNADSDELTLLANDESAPTPKPTKSKPKKDITEVHPYFISGAVEQHTLSGVKVAFCGTFEMGHATAEVTAKHYNATVVKQPKNADYVLLGKNSGPKTNDQIQEHGVETIDQAGFIELITYGVPATKRLGRAHLDPADIEQPSKKQKS